MRRFLDDLNSILAAAAAGMLAIFSLVVMYQVIARYLPFVPRALWTEEIARFTFIWMLFLGAASATRAKSHFVIDLIPNRLNGRWFKISEILVHSVVFTIGIYLVIGGAHFVEIGFKRISTTSGISLAWIYLAVPTCGAAIALFSAGNMFDAVWPKKVEPEKSRAELRPDFSNPIST